jgi:hypothetical protein
MSTIAIAVDAIHVALDSTDVPPQDTLDRALWRVRFVLATLYDATPATETEQDDTPLKDLLTDLVHYARLIDTDMTDLLDRAEWMAVQDRKDWGLQP